MDVAVLFQIFSGFVVQHFISLECFEAFAFFSLTSELLARSLHMIANGKRTEREEIKVKHDLVFHQRSAVQSHN